MCIRDRSSEHARIVIHDRYDLPHNYFGFRPLFEACRLLPVMSIAAALFAFVHNLQHFAYRLHHQIKDL